MGSLQAERHGHPAINRRPPTNAQRSSGLLLLFLMLLPVGLVEAANPHFSLISRLESANAEAPRRFRRQVQPPPAPSNVSLGYSGSQNDRGPWGPWSEVSECTRHCGGGVYYQTRTCLDPNRSCVGPTKRYFSCNIQECPEGTEDFRANQCARFNPIPFEGRYYSWVPFIKHSNPCELNCKPETERFYYRHARKVIDGTRCYDDDSSNICVDGICVELGCDRALGSNLKEDKCRVCGGNGSTCRTVKGVYDQSQGLRTGYNDILYIPAGSTNIVVEEVRPTNNYLAIRNQHGQSYLNGKWRIQPASTYDIAGTKFRYERPHRQKDRTNFPERLRALGPTNEPLFVQLLYQEPNQGVAYEYSVPLNAPDPGRLAGGIPPPTIADPAATGPSPATQQQGGGLPRYQWIFEDYSDCSKTCGTGVQQRTVYCALIDPQTGRQEPKAESLCDGSRRPSDTRPCHNPEPCQAKWRHNDWSECSCVTRLQHRNVFCSTGDAGECSNPEAEAVLPDAHCSANGTAPKPPAVQPCEPDMERCPRWIAGPWTKCDARCGLGKQTRTVQCGRKPVEIPEARAEPEPSTTPVTDEATTTAAATAAATADSTLTTTTPSAATEVAIISTTSSPAPEDSIEPQKRQVSDSDLNEVSDELMDESLCDPETKPPTEQSCSERACDDLGTVEWLTSAWSSCDMDCGPHTQTRQVVCGSRDGTVYPDAACVEARGSRPVDSQDCTDGAVCSRSLWFSSDWSHCSAQCGSGLKTRHVFCGHFDENGAVVKDEDESKCNADAKPPRVTVCQADSFCESGTWFSGPAGPCSVPCGGGQRQRPRFCLAASAENGQLEPAECDPDDQMTEQCNPEACDPEQLAAIVECKDSANGCCPDQSGQAADADFRNCQLSFANATDCLQAEYGCCPPAGDQEEEETFLALGPFGLGCPIRCQNTQFGCCPDMVTPANSSDLAECPMLEADTTTTTTMAATTTEMVSTTEASAELSTSISTTAEPTPENLQDCSKSPFGCCPDGWNAATGLDGQGCEEGSGDVSSFLSSTIASVMGMFTGTTEAPSPDSTTGLSCALTEFGCCPNERTPATGPNYYGCTCHDYPFGCCQDGYTPASGHNYEGCLCDRMLFGCCPDGRTPATGENQQGCNCDTSLYGCCPDMLTPAHGPNYHGCPCDTLTYGCCPGSMVPARGPDFAGCSCADTPFGCCADGVTVAYGPKFEGCPSGLPLDTKLASEVCNLKREVGPCNNFSVKWFFDVSYGGCNRFWYGGCEGNGNRFSSQEQCERACVKPEGPERCLLPTVVGPCNSSVESYHYNAQNRRCEPFRYGGCLGNTNRFETMEQCAQTCIYPEQALDPCEQPVQPGPCRGNYRRWYYRREEGRCREFTYGGCKGNLNNFQTVDECESACVSRTPFEICMLPKAQGQCLGSFPRWYFDFGSGVCREFTYSGCEGNRNRFVDRISCETTCNQTIREYYPDPSNGFDPMAGVPWPTDSHENELIPVRPYENVCALPGDRGSCWENIPQWYFNASTRSCQQFSFTGCGGNANRFNDQEHCEQVCGAYQPPPQFGPCLEPKEVGDPKCQDYQERWHYDVEDRRCHRFYFTGCGGNRNNFGSLEECSSRCEQRHAPVPGTGALVPAPVVTIGEFQVDHCFKQYDGGPCNLNTNQDIQWYYDRRDGVCKEFVYGGCGGNENRFASQYECQTKCWNSQDICQLPPVRGTCSANFTQWYFDHATNECYEFQFSGCYGNANRFNTKDTCEQHCRQPPAFGRSPATPTTGDQLPLPVATEQPASMHQQYEQQSRPTNGHQVADQCRAPGDPGDCRGYYHRWYFSVAQNQCLMFIWGGCGGNENRYESREQCEQVCLPRQAPAMEEYPGAAGTATDQNELVPEVLCRLPLDSGPCPQNEAKWYYDLETHNCLPFIYSGCGGNQNRFENYETCIQKCMGVTRTSAAYQPPVQRPAPPVHPAPPSSEPPAPAPVQPSRPGCEPIDCQEENCILGIDYYTDWRGCPSCRCTNPCNDVRCSDDMSCSVELFRDEMTGKIQANAECRLRVKPGQCPPPTLRAGQDENNPSCIDQCRSDADCRNSDKCCHNGCADVCLPVYNDTAPAVPPYNYYNYSTVDQPPQPDQNVYYTERPEQEPAGYPVPPYQYPAAVPQPEHDYHAPPVEEEPEGAAVQDDLANEIHAEPGPEVPAQIRPGNPKRVIASHGAPAYLPCNAYGRPRPQVIWWRGDRMLPQNSLKYQQMDNYTLLVRNVEPKDSGYYTCDVHNSLARDRWDVELLLDSKVPEPDIVPYHPRLLTNLNPADANAPAGQPSTNRTEAELSNEIMSSVNREQPGAADITTEIEYWPKDYRVGSMIQLDCLVKNRQTGGLVPTAAVLWYVNSDIPLSVDQSNHHHYRILPNNSLQVFHLNRADSGEYRCRASSGPHTDTSSVRLQVEADCQDNPIFAQCSMIVQNKLCQNPHYRQFCCRSCYIDKYKMEAAASSGTKS